MTTTRGLKPSLRLKMTLWFLGIFMVAFAAVLVGAWLLYQESTQRQLDERLEDLARGVGEMMQDETRPPWIDRFQSLQPTERTFVVLAVRDAEGDVLASQWLVDTEALPPIPNSAGADVVIRPLAPGDALRLIGRAVSSRIVTYRSTLPDGSVRYIDLATASDIQSETRSFLLSVFIVGGLGALLASGLAAWLISGRAVRPMKQLADAADRVDPKHISGRIDVDGDEHEIAELRTALNQALTRLEDGYRAQERFISNVAHDLKTPIAVMLTEAQVRSSANATREELEEFRDSMIVEMRRLGGLVESFLTLALADQGASLARLVDVAIVDLVLDAVAECDREAGHRNVRLVATLTESGDADTYVRGDPDLLRTMIVNLIRNAIRHSPAGGVIEIEAALRSESVLLSVRDRGPGIPEEYREAVFDRFVTVPSGPAPGTGLGLAIASSVAQMHGGVVTLRNRDDGGCIAAVDLPLAGPHVARETSAVETGPIEA
jgi:signal transduction histidine kinase